MDLGNLLNYIKDSMMPILLSLQNLTKNYSKSEKLFEPIDLHVQIGDSISIVGANGSGKSTLMQIIAGLESQSEGQRILAKKGLKIAYLPQHAPMNILPFSVRQVILGIHAKGLTPLQEKYLEKFDLNSHLNNPYRSLSLGQKRKTLIIRNLDPEADLLLFDEPFASLDRTSQEVLIQLFIELRENRRAFVSVVHEHHLGLNFFNKTLALRKCCQ